MNSSTTVIMDPSFEKLLCAIHDQLSEYRLVVRKAKPPDFGNFEFSQVAVTPENNNKTTYGERISG